MAISSQLAGIFFCTSSVYSSLRRSRLSQETTRVVSCLVSLAADERLDGGIALDDARQERALVHVVEHGRELQGAGQILDDFQIRRAVSSGSNSWSSRMKSRRRLERFSLN